MVEAHREDQIHDLVVRQKAARTLHGSRIQHVFVQDRVGQSQHVAVRRRQLSPALGRQGHIGHSLRQPSLQGHARPDAFLCLGTHILSGVIGVLRSMHIAFPGDVSLVSVGDSDFPRYYNPAISAIAWDASQVVDHFTRAILHLADAPSRELVPCEFLARESS